MPLIDARKLDAIFLDCLFRPEEITNNETPPGAVVVKAITTTFGFHPDRLKSHEGEVREMLGALPVQFIDGGGWSFLNACIDKNGEQWGEHIDMEQLFSLGMGLKLAEYCAPRELWSLLPGGVPYIVVKLQEGKK